MNNKVYACSDLHGNKEVYDNIKKRLCAEDKLYIIGDVIDRGSSSFEIIKDMMVDPRIEFIIGNHELFLLDSINDEGIEFEKNEWFEIWGMICNGGKYTSQKFLEMPIEERKSIVDYLKSSYSQVGIEVNGQMFVLCHSSFIVSMDDEWTRFYRYETHDDIFAAVWNNPNRFRDENFPYSKYMEYPNIKFITGHVPIQRIVNSGKLFNYENFYDIDYGIAYGTDTACLLCLNDMSCELVMGGKEVNG